MTSPDAAPGRRLKVAQFTDNYGPGSNGLMFAVQQIEGNLLDAGHEVIVVAPEAKGPNPHHGRPGRTEVRLPSVRVPKMPTSTALMLPSATPMAATVPTSVRRGVPGTVTLLVIPGSWSV